MWLIKSTLTEEYLPRESACCKFFLAQTMAISTTIFIIFRLSAILYTLSKQAKVLAANKLHLQVNNRLQSLKAPPGIQDQVDVSIQTSYNLYADSVIINEMNAQSLSFIRKFHLRFWGAHCIIPQSKKLFEGCTEFAF